MCSAYFDGKLIGIKSNQGWKIMNGKDPIDNLVNRLSSLFPESANQLKNDVEQNIRAGLEGGLKQLNVVTREEFDIQNAVLLRTREKVEALEKQVQDLEEKIQELTSE